MYTPANLPRGWTYRIHSFRTSLLVTPISTEVCFDSTFPHFRVKMKGVYKQRRERMQELMTQEFTKIGFPSMMLGKMELLELLDVGPIWVALSIPRGTLGYRMAPYVSCKSKEHQTVSNPHYDSLFFVPVHIFQDLSQTSPGLASGQPPQDVPAAEIRRAERLGPCRVHLQGCAAVARLGRHLWAAGGTPSASKFKEWCGILQAIWFWYFPIEQDFIWRMTLISRYLCQLTYCS